MQDAWATMFLWDSLYQTMELPLDGLLTKNYCSPYQLLFYQMIFINILHQFSPWYDYVYIIEKDSLTLSHPCIPKIKSVSFEVYWTQIASILNQQTYHFFFYLIYLLFYSFLPNYFKFAIFLSLNCFYYC